MSSKDLRTLYDLGTEDGRRTANAILQDRPPHSRMKAAGFDCLIVVLRRIYSRCLLGEESVSSPKWLKASENINPILGHAWHKFGQAPEEVEEVSEERKQVFRKLSALQLNPLSSFEVLCHSEMMNCTFWAQDAFRLVDNLYEVNTGDEAGVQPDEIARMSLLELDHIKYPDMTLEDAVNKAFGVIDLQEPVISMPSRPWVIRVLYHSHDQEERRLRLKDLRHLQLPIWEEDMNSPNICFDEVGKVFYELMAIVRIRDEDHPDDFVRTYSSYGFNIIPEYEPPAFMERSWRLTDPSARYMLFYERVDGELEPEVQYPVPRDEVATPQQVDVDLFNIVGKDLRKTSYSVQPAKPSDSQQKAQQGPQSSQTTTLPIRLVTETDRKSN
ncbi:hypothetical protein ACHAPA_004528 [Fusarium lateritium]